MNELPIDNYTNQITELILNFAYFALWWSCMDIVSRFRWLPSFVRYFLIFFPPIFIAGGLFDYELDKAGKIFALSGLPLLGIGIYQFVFSNYDPKQDRFSLDASKTKIHSEHGDVEVDSSAVLFSNLAHSSLVQAQYRNRWELVISGLALLILGAIVQIVIELNPKMLNWPSL